MKNSLYFFLLFVLLTACTEDLTSVAEHHEASELSHYLPVLQERGIPFSHVHATKDHIIVDHDILFDKSALDLPLESDPEKAIVLTNVVSWNNVRDIDYIIRGSFSNFQKDLIRLALQRWENINDCAINFNETTSLKGADLTISSYDDPILPEEIRNRDGAGAAWFPQYGQIGRWVGINLDNRGVEEANVTEFRLLVQHEVGHALGFAHSNGSVGNISNSPLGQSGNFVRVVPHCTLNQETGNVMVPATSSTDLSILGEISADERKTAHKMYPGYFSWPYITNHIIFSGSSGRRIKFTMNCGNDDPVTVKVERFYPWQLYSPVSTTGPVTLGGCGSTGRFVYVDSPTGTWSFRFKVGNHGGDYYSPNSSLYQVNVW